VQSKLRLLSHVNDIEDHLNVAVSLFSSQKNHQSNYTVGNDDAKAQEEGKLGGFLLTIESYGF